MTIYEVVSALETNMNFNIIVEDDADRYTCGDCDNGEMFEGEVSDFLLSDLYDEIQDEEVTDLFTLADGRLCICYDSGET